MLHQVRVIVPLAVAAAVALSAGATLAGADRNHPPRVRDGNYGKQAGNRSIAFKIADRHVRRLYFTMPISCVNDDTGEEYTRYFDGSNLSGGRVGRNARYRRNFSVSSNGRDGDVTVTLNFRHGRPIADVAVLVPQAGLETCDGEISMRVPRLG